MKNYLITNIKENYDEDRFAVLNRIKAKRSFSLNCNVFGNEQQINIDESKPLGWVEKASNIEYADNCFIAGKIMGNSIVKDNCYIDEDSVVEGASVVCGTSSILNSQVDGATINSSHIKDSVVLGKANVSNGAEISNSTISGCVKIDGKNRIKHSNISDNVSISGSVKIDEGNPSDINYFRGESCLRGTAIVKDNVEIHGPVSISSGVVVSDNAIISGHVHVFEKGVISGFAEIGVSRKFPNGTIKIKAPMICGKGDFGVVSEDLDSYNFGIYCYKKNTKACLIEYASMINGREIARATNSWHLLYLTAQKMHSKIKTFEILDAFQRRNKSKKIENAIRKNPDIECEIRAIIINEFLKLIVSEFHSSTMYKNQSSKILESCMIDLSTNSILCIKDFNFCIKSIEKAIRKLKGGR